MLFLILGIIETFATYLMIIIMLISNYPIEIIPIISMLVSCFFWFSLYAMWKRIKSQKQEIKLLQDSLNECRRKLNLSPLEEKKTENISNSPFEGF